MYHVLNDKEIIEYINEYLLTKSYNLFKLEHNELDRIHHYYDEKFYLLITKNIYDPPNVRRYYYWFEDKSKLESFIERVKLTTISKYLKNYFNLYQDFKRKYSEFKKSKFFSDFDKRNIQEQTSLTFTYYDLKKYKHIFKHKYQNLYNFDSSIFKNYETSESTNEVKLIKYPQPNDCIINFKQ